MSGTTEAKQPGAKTFLDEIEEVIRENGWASELVAELLSETPLQTVRVRRSKLTASDPDEDIVNVYQEEVTFIDQVMQECFRYLRTGRTGR